MLTLNGSVITSPAGYWFDKYRPNPNPYKLPAKTVRFKFSDLSVDPTKPYPGPDTGVYPGRAGGIWTRVSYEPNIWDYRRPNATQYIAEFEGADGFWAQPNCTIEVLGVNTEGLSFIDFGGNYTDICYFETNHFTSFSGMFEGCNLLTSVPEYDTSNATDFTSMFRDCTSLTYVPDFDMSSAVNTFEMFRGCTSLETVPAFNTGAATTMDGMFYGCTNLKEVPLIDTSAATNLESMFWNCSSLTDVANFNMSSATSAAGMFYGCTSLETTPAFNATNVTDARWMFEGCTAFKVIPDIDFQSVNVAMNMFYNCVNVESGITNMYDKLVQTVDTSLAYGCTDCFYKCGSNTTTGAAELAQIPSDWK